MRYLCLLAVLLMPLDAAAQKPGRSSNAGRSADRGSNDQGSGDRNRGDRDRSSGERRSDQRNNTSTQFTNPSMPWWENQPLPWWERQNTPWWKKGRVAQSPESWNPARRLLNNTPPPPIVNHRQDFGRKHRGNSVVYVLPAYPYGFFPYTNPGVTEAYVTPPAPNQVVSIGAPQAPPAPLGFLRLEVEPRELLQIFVDGIYIGSPAELGDEIALAPGIRRIELRAPGYRTLTFDTEILNEQLITYRGALERQASQQIPPPSNIVRPAATPGPPTVYYVIPGCYLGNVEPTPSSLRPGCDISKLTTIKP